MSPLPPAGLFARIREASAEVARRAKQVEIDPRALGALAEELCASEETSASADPAWRPLASDEATLAFVVTLDAVNFGSGWFPHLRKRPGCSGYQTVAAALRERFEASGPWSAAELCGLGVEDLAGVLRQPLEPPVDSLLGLYTRALVDLGKLLSESYGGRFAGLVEAAAGSAERLVGILATMPLYRDVERYQELEVPFYKRAQITASDLAGAFHERGPGEFRDLDQLTLFADNLVPHVLRMRGVLRYAPALSARIDREELLPQGCSEEVEIRALALHAVEELVASCCERGFQTRARSLDHRLWQLGQDPAIKAVPRHRTRCSFY